MSEILKPAIGANVVGPRRIMSGMRPTHRLHIGNYFGALKNWLTLQNEATCFFGVMDWHALTNAYKNPKEPVAWVREIIAEWIAWGLDPKKNVIFIQSQIPETIELFMFFSMLTPMGWLERVPTWKDAEEEAKASDTHNLGRFAYPVLQAADIVLFGGTHIPIGQDQVAHLEISREIVRRFNFLYGGHLIEPQALLTDTPMIAGTDGRKMSKSYGNYFALTQDESELDKSVKAMVTDPQRVRRNDPGNPDVCSVFAYHKLFSSEADQAWARQGCVSAGIGCGDCKKRLSSNINVLMQKPRETKKQLLQDSKALDSIISEGNERARVEAEKTMRHVREVTGFRIS